MNRGVELANRILPGALAAAVLAQFTVAAGQAHTQEPVRLCVVLDAQLSEVPAEVVGADTLVGGRPFREVYPPRAPNYAAEEQWYRDGSGIEFRERRYEPAGPPLRIPLTELTRVGELSGFPVFERTDSPAIIYIPVGPGCEFQGYLAPEMIPPSPVEVNYTVRVCAVVGSELRVIEAMYNPATGDTLVASANGLVSFATAYPTDRRFLISHAFWKEQRPIIFRDRRYRRYGLPTVVRADELEAIGTYRTIPVFRERGVGPSSRVLYLPIRRNGCEFQPYAR
jgi:hypothetical protein